MRKVDMPKVICFILIGIIMCVVIHFLLYLNSRPKYYVPKCASAYGCNNCDGNVCDCLYCSKHDTETDNCIKEEQIQCEDLRTNYE